MESFMGTPWTNTWGVGTLLKGTSGQLSNFFWTDLNQKTLWHPAQALVDGAAAAPKYLAYIFVQHRDNEVDKV